MKSLLLWKKIIVSPFSGYGELKKETPVLIPLLILLLLMVLSILMLFPVFQSEAYGKAVIQVQIDTLAKKGQELSLEQQEALKEQLTSPTMRTITRVSSIAGGLVTFLGIMLLSALLLKLLFLIFREETTFKLCFKILVFTGIISVAQGLVKNLITITGNWERLLYQVQDTQGLKTALQSSVSLAALFSVETLGKIGFYLVDTLTDIFNWIYYIFIYAALRMSAGLEKNKALKVTLIFAGCYILIGAVFILIF